MKKAADNSQRAVFTTRFGAIATTVGSAIGLGNIWRFPYEAGEHGGGAFLLCYIFFVFAIGVPVLCAEFFMGRSTRSNSFGAYNKMSGGKGWRLTGYIGIVASLLILSFYSVVAGWTVEYGVASLTGNLEFSDSEIGHQQFMTLTDGWRTLMWTVIFIVINCVIIIGGVTKGIERASNIMMPILFLLLIAFCVNSVTMPEFSEGMAFLFKPDFSKLNTSVMLGAMGQAFFSLSLGLGCMLTYGSYFSDTTRIGRTAVTIASLDFVVSVLAGIIVFPAVFSFNVSPEAGPTLVFEVLPFIFSKLPGGAVWSTLFFLLLFLAAVTSTVSMSETTISYLCEEKKMSRKKASIITSVIILVGGTLCSLCFGPLSDFKIFGMTFFDLFDYLSSNILLPFGGMLCSYFVGWKVKRSLLEKELTNGGRVGFRLMSVLVFFLRFICPSAIFLILLHTIGLI